MSRPRSNDKRNAILAAATRVIASQGLGAATATIAHEANVANGSLFTYFETKTELLNQLDVELKTEMVRAALQGMPESAALREQFWSVWSNWMRWAMSNPEKRRALAHLTVADAITPETRARGHQAMLRIGELLERTRAEGPMRDVPMAFVLEIMNSLADATIDFMERDPANAETHCQVGFEALWRAVT
jgi:AcrR family transcriptional regulator